MRKHLSFLIAGLAFGFVCLFATFRWLEVSQMLLNKPLFVSSKHSSFIDTLRHIVLYLPLVAVALVFTWRIISGPRVKASAFAAGAFLPHLTLLIYSMFGPALLIKWHNEEFDAVKWRAESTLDFARQWPVRLCMVDDLLKKKRLDGLTRSSVEQMLGPGVVTHRFPRSANEVAYYLGPQRDFWRDGTEFLTIRFNGKSIVEGYSIDVD